MSRDEQRLPNSTLFSAIQRLFLIREVTQRGSQPLFTSREPTSRPTQRRRKSCLRNRYFLLVLTSGSALAHAPATITAGFAKIGNFGTSAQRRFGPYATLRRANEVANYARSKGYNAKVIYAGSIIYGTREYYVDVW